MMSDQLIAAWKREEETPFCGWDFSYLDGRMLEGQPPWSYTTRAGVLMQKSASVLDMGTGGGELLLKMRQHWPQTVVVTEEYPPNVRLARERLEPLGVRVVDVELRNHDPLPFADGEFDLIINRHSAFNVDEVARILAPEGVFLTQQVHGLWAQNLLAHFDSTPQWPDATPEFYLPWLVSAGLEIVAAEEWSGDLAFTDVGAVVYYLHAVPWLVPGFSVASHGQQLLDLQAKLNQSDSLVFTARKYLLEAKKAGTTVR